MSASGPPPRDDFDIAALYDALDAARRARGLTWTQVAREVSGLVSRARVRPIAASTITGLRTRRVAEGDGVLQMLRWLGRTPESFVPGDPGHSGSGPADASTALPEPGPDRLLRFDTAAVHAALEARRLERGLSWKAVADDIGGTNAASLINLSNGGRTAFPMVMRIVRWLDRPAAAFTRVSDR
jgi:uncharacterized protein YfiM (DUF2279 family)